MHSRRDSDRVLKYFDGRALHSQGYGVTLRAECRPRYLTVLLEWPLAAAGDRVRATATGNHVRNFEVEQSIT